MEMGGNGKLLDGSKWELSSSFLWEWKWDENGNEVTEMAGIWYGTSLVCVAGQTDGQTDVQDPYCDLLGRPRNQKYIDQ